MGSITILDRGAEEVLEVLGQLYAECREGNICGAIIITQKHESFELDIPGTFSTDPESIASIVGRLQIASNIFCQMTNEIDESELD